VLRSIVAMMGGSGGGDGPRYWRVTSIQTDGGFLEISELQMLEDSVVSAPATVTYSIGTDNGELYDGNLTTRVFWAEVDVEVGESFWIKFDFGPGAGKNINGVKQGGYDNSLRHMHEFTLQWSSNDSDWTPLGTKTGLTYPGNNTLSSEYTFP